MIDRQELSYLADLFDDSDEVVAACVDKRIREMGREVIPELERLRHDEPDVAKKRILSDRITRYNADLRIEDLRRLALDGSVEAYTLYEGTFLTSSMLNPQVHREQFEEAFYQCTYQYHQEASELRTAVENIGVFNHIFFHRLRFTVCDQNLTSEKNAMAYDALRSRRGNPFVIAVIYMMMAEDAGLPIFPLCFPGGFVPAYVENGRELFYINLNSNGEIFPQSRLKDYLIEQGMPFDHNQFLIRRRTVVLNVYLESLSYLYTQAGNVVMQQRIQKALAALGDERFLISDEKQED